MIDLIVFEHILSHLNSKWLLSWAVLFTVGHHSKPKKCSDYRGLDVLISGKAYISRRGWIKQWDT